MRLRKIISTLIISTSLFGAISYINNTGQSAQAATSKVPHNFKSEANWVTNYQKIKPVKLYSYEHHKKITAKYVRINNNFSGAFGFNPIYYYYSKNKRFIVNSVINNPNAGAYPLYTFVNKNHYRLDSGIGKNVNHYKIRINHPKSITIWITNHKKSHRIGTFHRYPDGDKELGKILKTKF